MVIPGGHVLCVDPILSATALWDSKYGVGAGLTARKQIEDSPSLASDKPVSRQFEMDYYGYFGWTPYWAGPFAWGQYPTPMQVGHAEPKSTEEKQAWDSHLRSMREVTGYWIQADDGEIGHVEDFVIDDETWTIRYLIVDTRNWWPGKKVLVSPRWIDKVSWNESKVFINLPREAIRKSPEYSEESLISRDYETDLHRHYEWNAHFDCRAGFRQTGAADGFSP
jgi:hypothetical protein